MRIFLVDDHLSFCEGFIATIKMARPDYEIEFTSDSEFVPTELVGKNNYDLIITDLLKPGWSGIDLIKYLKRNHCHTPIMVMSSIQDERTIKEVFDLGVVGYLPKSYGTQQIVDAIESCRGGDIHVPSFYNGTVSGASPDLDEAQIKLTKRQAEILTLMDQGLGNQEIADKLFIGKSTVKTHIRLIFKLFDVNSRIACLRAAKQHGALR